MFPDPQGSQQLREGFVIQGQVGSSDSWPSSFVDDKDGHSGQDAGNEEAEEAEDEFVLLNSKFRHISAATVSVSAGAARLASFLPRGPGTQSGTQVPNLWLPLLVCGCRYYTAQNSRFFGIEYIDQFYRGQKGTPKGNYGGKALQGLGGASQGGR
ncbi:hypothetical protein MGN70_007073 [Eutypa lata]|nr:hypothetical protein MGN70_007073 [Eutypa lata]